MPISLTLSDTERTIVRIRKKTGEKAKTRKRKGRYEKRRKNRRGVEEE
jgi:hypothetical protein